jgi:diguanylate cyclase (GGDEF)-like protein
LWNGPAAGNPWPRARIHTDGANAARRRVRCEWVATAGLLHYFDFAWAPVRLAGCPSRKGDRMIPNQQDPEHDQVDILTGARLGPGLADMQHEIQRANRGNGRLVVACVNVDGLNATNDSNSHHAGDLILKHIVNLLQANLRCHQSIIRLGGDEFACTISDTSIEDVRQRFHELIPRLSSTPGDVSISVGLAELVRGDSPLDLIDRADRRLIASRDTQTRNRQSEV